MSYELVFTSAPKGLQPSSRGFCSVAFTDGMPANYVQFCESLSGYVHIYLTHDPNYKNNPIVFSHLLATLGGKSFSVLSRISAYVPDYTGRTNKLAHHLMLELDERNRLHQGPAVLMNSETFFYKEWTETPAYLPPNRIALPSQEISSFQAVTWEKMLGNAGSAAAGVLAQSFLDNPAKPTFILFEPGMDVLSLIAEAQALLPKEKRWNVTFSTYFTALPVGLECAWRCCLPDSDALKVARRTPGVLVIDLVKRRVEGPQPADTPLIKFARTGIPPLPKPEVIPEQHEDIKESVKTPVINLRLKHFPRISPKPQTNYIPSNIPPPSKQQKMGILVTFLRLAVILIILIIAIILALNMCDITFDQIKCRLGFSHDGIKTNAVTQKDGITKPAAQKLEAIEDFNQTKTNEATNDFKKKKQDETTSQIVQPLEKQQPTIAKTINIKEIEPSKSTQMMMIREFKEQKITLPGQLRPVNFYGTNGTKIKMEDKLSPSSVETKQYFYRDANRKQLAEVTTNLKQFVISKIGPPVQMIEVVSGNTNELFICNPFTGILTNTTDSGSYQINLKKTDTVEKLFEYLNYGKKKLTAMGTKCSTNSPAKAVFGISEIDNEGRIQLKLDEKDREQWSGSGDKIRKNVAELKDKIKGITDCETLLFDSQKSFTNAIAEFETAKEETKGKEQAKKLAKDKAQYKKEAGKNRKEKAEVLRNNMCILVPIYLSNTNLIPESSSSFETFKSRYLKRTEESSSDQQNNNDRFGHNDPDLYKLFKGIEDNKKDDLSNAANDFNSMISRWIKELEFNKEKLDSDKEQKDKLLAQEDAKPVSIDISYDDVLIIKGTSKP